MITLREATSSDLSLMFKWRNDPEIYQGFYQQTEPLQWEEHENWWASRPPSWETSIIMLGEEPIGVVNIGQMEHWSPEIGYYLGSSEYFGKGYMKEALLQTFDYLKERGYDYCHTTIKIENERSSGLAWRLGFTMLGGAREEEVWLTKDLRQTCLI